MSLIYCDLCGLDKGCHTPRMKPDDSNLMDGEAADILFIGEAPGADEDRLGVPFVGRSGQLLREMINAVGLQHYGIVFTNIIRCHPPDNKTPSAKQIGYCIETLWQEIADYDPLVVVLLGNVPLKAVLGESGITNWRGVIVERENRTFVPTFHPAFVLRNTAELPTVLEDLEIVETIAAGTQLGMAADAEYIIEYITTADAAREMTRRVRQAGYCSFDTEMTSLRPFDKDQDVVICSIAIDTPKKVAWAIIPTDSVVRRAVIDILWNPKITKVGHNVKFDALAALGVWNVWVESIVGDSMLVSYILDSTPGRHGLKMLAGRYLGMYDYDKPLNDWWAHHKEADPRKGGDLGAVPIKILSDYTAKDAIATLELHKRLKANMTPAQHVLYEQLLMPASAMLTQMEANGCVIDREVCQDYIELYEEEQLNQLSIMADNKCWRKYCKWRKSQDESYVFNPNSHDQMRELLFDRRFFGLEPLGYTDTGKPSTKWDYIKVYAQDVPFVNHYRYYRLLDKMLSTYLRPALDRWPSTGDGRVRSNYLIHGTITGRLASRTPNLQNIPTPEKEPGTILASHPIKDIFTHTHGDGCLLAADYAGMELRTMASISQCQGMIRAFELGQDVHSIVTCALSRYYGDNWTYEEFMALLHSNDPHLAEMAAARRYRSKWVNWTLLYGGSAYTLNRLYGLDETEAKSLINIYYEMYPEILEYKQDTLDLARIQGYVESPFGRRRYLPYINDKDRKMRAGAEREAINMPIQSAASDILLCALIIIDEELIKMDLNSMMVNTVHDSVMFDVWPDELHALAHLCKDVMENITVYGPKRFPGLPFDWFIVPLVVDLEIGSHYGSLKHFNLDNHSLKQPIYLEASNEH